MPDTAVTTAVTYDAAEAFVIKAKQDGMKVAQIKAELALMGCSPTTIAVLGATHFAKSKS